MAGMHNRISRDIIVNLVRRGLICIAPQYRYFKSLLIGRYNIRSILASPVVLTNAGIGCSKGRSREIVLFLSCYLV